MSMEIAAEYYYDNDTSNDTKKNTKKNTKKDTNKSGYQCGEIFMPCITFVLFGAAFWYLMHTTSEDLMNLSEDKMY